MILLGSNGLIFKVYVYVIKYVFHIFWITRYLLMHCMYSNDIYNTIYKYQYKVIFLCMLTNETLFSV